MDWVGVHWDLVGLDTRSLARDLPETFRREFVPGCAWIRGHRFSGSSGAVSLTMKLHGSLALLTPMLKQKMDPYTLSCESGIMCASGLIRRAGARMSLYATAYGYGSFTIQ